MTRRSWQQRLAMKQDIMKRKLLDNSITMIGDATDCIRIKTIKNDEGDITSRKIKDIDLVSVIFPVLKEIPYRQMEKTDDGYRITSLVTSAETDFVNNFIIQSPHYDRIDIDDLIVRVLQDPEVDYPIVYALQVIESLGTFGGQMLIQHSFNTCLYNQDLPQDIVDAIGDVATRRLHIGF